MPRRRKQAGEPVEPDELTDVTPAQKKKFTELGYKPYRTESGKIKWLTDDQYIYKRIKMDNPISFHLRFKAYKDNRRPRNTMKIFYRMFLDNWFIAALVAGLLITLIYIEEVIAILGRFI